MKQKILIIEINRINALVKTPLTTAKVRISGDGAKQVLEGLKTLFNVEVKEDESATESDWYKEAKTNWTTGTEIRTQRQKRGWMQKKSLS